MFENNFTVLEKMVREDAIIIPVAQHRKPDGTFDLERNLKLWNDAIRQYEQIPLWEEGAPGYDGDKTPLQPQPSLIFVPGQNGGEKRGTIVVAHGGGFSSRTGCEGMNVAYYFAQKGFNTAILTYRLQPYTRYDALADMQRAIRLLRANKEKLGITGQVVAMGFSAGGMLSGNCATHFDLGEPPGSRSHPAGVLPAGRSGDLLWRLCFQRLPRGLWLPLHPLLLQPGRAVLYGSRGQCHPGHAPLFCVADHQRRCPAFLCPLQRFDCRWGGV